jgi:hypothetical protein
MMPDDTAQISDLYWYKQTVNMMTKVKKVKSYINDLIIIFDIRFLV